MNESQAQSWIDAIMRYAADNPDCPKLPALFDLAQDLAVAFQHDTPSRVTDIPSPGSAGNLSRGGQGGEAG